MITRKCHESFHTRHGSCAIASVQRMMPQRYDRCAAPACPLLQTPAPPPPPDALVKTNRLEGLSRFGAHCFRVVSRMTQAMRWSATGFGGPTKDFLIVLACVPSSSPRPRDKRGRHTNTGTHASHARHLCWGSALTGPVCSCRPGPRLSGMSASGPGLCRGPCSKGPRTSESSHLFNGAAVNGHALCAAGADTNPHAHARPLLRQNTREQTLHVPPGTPIFTVTPRTSFLEF